jgi:hypothetical protein
VHPGEGARNANALRDREEKHANLRTEIELLNDTVYSLVCLRDRIVGGMDDKVQANTNPPVPPMHSLLGVLENGPRMIADSRAQMQVLMEEINASLF